MSYPRIHLAGPMIDLVQRCSRCGYVLCDYRGAMVPSGGAIHLHGWGVGDFVTVEGEGVTCSYVGRGEHAIDCDLRVM